MLPDATPHVPASLTVPAAFGALPPRWLVGGLAWLITAGAWLPKTRAAGPGPA